MKLRYFHVDAFTGRVFGGNPAGVCPLDEWLPDETMQKIAAENNLAETAFCLPEGEHFGLRWFSPEVEVDLCGHATLATAKVLFEEMGVSRSEIVFTTKSGILTVKRRGDLLEMEFPSRPATACEVPELLVRALGKDPVALLKSSRDYLAVYESEGEVANLHPDFETLRKVETFGTIVTAPGDISDFVSRFFVPRAGIPEDPVTGSSHCTLIPYWAAQLGKETLFARQISRRGGEIYGEHRGEKVGICGRAVLYSRGELIL